MSNVAGVLQQLLSVDFDSQYRSQHFQQSQQSRGPTTSPLTSQSPPSSPATAAGLQAMRPEAKALLQRLANELSIAVAPRASCIGARTHSAAPAALEVLRSDDAATANSDGVRMSEKASAVNSNIEHNEHLHAHDPRVALSTPSMPVSTPTYRELLKSLASTYAVRDCIDDDQTIIYFHSLCCDESGSSLSRYYHSSSYLIVLLLLISNLFIIILFFHCCFHCRRVGLARSPPSVRVEKHFPSSSKWYVHV